MKYLKLAIIILVVLIIIIFFLKKDNFNDNFINNTVIVNFFTKDLCEEWKNHVFTLKKYNLDKYLVVFPLDNDALNCVKSENINYNTKFLNKINISGADIGTLDFKQIVYYKILSIKHFIDLNYNVFYLDTDTIVLGNIIEDIKTFPKNMDLYAQEDSNTICTGCMLLLPTNNTKKMIDTIKFIFEKTYNESPKGDLSDQKFINEYVHKNKNFKYHLLPWQKYASGKQYFYKNEKYFKKNKPIFLHNNYIIGLKNKIKRFKENGLWYI